MPWLKKHNPTINWDKEQISFNSESCTEICLEEPPVVKGIPEEEAIRENRKTTILNAHLDEIQVRKVEQDAKIPSKGSEKVARRDLYANENSRVPPRGRRLIRTGISLVLPEGTYGRIASRSGLALHHGLTMRAGVIDADFTGQITVLLMNTSDDEYEVQKANQIAQIIIERINESELEEKLELPPTERANKGFESSDEPAKPIEINFITARLFGRMYKKAEKSKDQMGILRIKTNDKEITIASATISTEIAIAEKRTKDKQQIRNLVPREYHDYITLFEDEERKHLPPPRHNDHTIELDQTKGVPNKNLYPMKEKELEELRDYLGKNLSRGWIRECDSPVGAPILFVKKKDGSLRLCVDYRGLNAVTKKDRYPLPPTGEALDRLSRAKYYTKLDIKDAYHNIRIREGDEWKTAFKTQYGLFEYTVMPLGLTNAPATFQRWINSTLNRYLDICCLVYLDDILIYSNDLAQHKKDVRNIMETIRKAGMKLKPSKCEFHKNETEYL